MALFASIPQSFGVCFLFPLHAHVCTAVLLFRTYMHKEMVQWHFALHLQSGVAGKAGLGKPRYMYEEKMFHICIQLCTRRSWCDWTHI